MSASVSAQPLHAWGMSGSHVCYMDEATVVMACGNGIVIWPPNTNRQSMIWTNGRCITALAVSRQERVIAVGVEKSAPVISLYSYPERQLITNLESPETAKLSYSALSFNRSGSLLASVSSLPDFTLSIWDWKQRTIVATSVMEHLHCDGVSFNPRSKELLCTIGGDRAIVWRLESVLERPTLTPLEIEVPQAAGNITAHCWGVRDDLYLATASGQLLHAHDTMDVIFDAGCAITSILLARQHIVVGLVDGRVVWIPHAVLSSEDDLDRDSPLQHNIQAGTDSVTHLEFSPDYTFIAASLAGGNIVNIAVDRSLQPSVPIQVDTICELHSAQISGLDSLSNKRVASCSTDGSLRVWSLQQRKLLHNIRLSTALTALASSPSNVPPMLAVGDQLGVVRIYSVPNNLTQAPKLIWRQRYHTKSVTALSWDPNGKYLVSGGADGKVFFTAFHITGNVKTSVGGLGAVDDSSQGLFSVLGFILLTTEVLSLTWEADSSKLYALILHGNVFRLTPPPVTASDNELLELAPQQVNMSVMKATVDLTTIATPLKTRPDQSFYALGADKKLKIYQMPDMDDEGLVDDNETLPPEQEFEGHDKVASAVSFGPGDRLIASGGSCGLLVLRHMTALDKFASVRCHSAGSGGISKICFSADGANLVTGGMDGSLIVWQVQPADPPAESNSGATFEITVVDSVEDKASAAMELNFMEVLTRERRRAEMIVSQASRSRGSDKLVDLGKRLGDVIAQNEDVPELEKLRRSDFLLDFALRDRIKQTGDLRVAQVQEEIKFENLARDYLWERIKDECYDSMDKKGVMLRGFKTATSVQNFAMRKLAPEEVARLERIKQLRRMELAQRGLKTAASVGVKNISAFDGSSPLVTLPGLDVAPIPGKPVQAQAVAKTAVDDDDDEGDKATLVSSSQITSTAMSQYVPGADASDAELLYHALDLSSRRRRITQTHLLGVSIRNAQELFNREFDSLVTKKHEAIAKIEERRDRLTQITQELQTLTPDGKVDDSSWNIPKPTWARDETAETVLSVRDDEVTVEKFVSPAEQARLEDERKKEAERLAKARGDDIGVRGLESMMDGKLESPQEEQQLLLKLERPAELNKPLEEMNEEELRLLKEFQKKEQQLNEEREKLRKQLFAEQKKLLEQVQEIYKTFDERVVQLFNTQLQVKQFIYEYELKIVKLGQALQREEEYEYQEAEAEQARAALSLQRATSAAQIQEIKRKLDVATDKYNLKHNDERALDKQFRRDFGDAGASLQPLLVVWKKRGRPQRFEGTHQSLDPYSQMVDPVSVTNAPDVSVEESDRPDGLSDDIWTRFVQKRAERILLEAEVARLKTAMDELQDHYTRFCESDAALLPQKDIRKDPVNELREALEMSAINLECVFKLKQGFVEVPQAAVVTDYSDAVMIPRETVERKNADIVKHGSDKVSVLTKIKELNSAIHGRRWDLQERQLRVDDLKLEMQQLQLLRVTKELQENIKGGSQQRQAAEMRLLQKQMEHSDKTHQLKLSDRKKILGSLRRQVVSMSEENTALDEQLQQMQMNVADRQTIHNLQVTRKTGDGGGHEAKFKNSSTRRKLAEIAKAQTEEIAFLQDELDRLRQRTFPSFQRVVRPPL